MENSANAPGAISSSSSSSQGKNARQHFIIISIVERLS